MANFETEVYELVEAFCFVKAINMTKKLAIVILLLSWSKLTILPWVSRFFFNFSHDKTLNLIVFGEISFSNVMFLCSIKTEMFTGAES